MNTNNIHAFIKNGNDAIIEHVHALVAWLVVNHKAPLSFATNVNLNEVIQVASYLKPGSYVPMTPGKINRAFISMFSKFTMCVKARTMYMPAGYDELTDEYAGSSCGLWSAMATRIISSSSSLAFQCIGSTCSRGFGTNWHSAWPCQIGTMPKHAMMWPWLS